MCFKEKAKSRYGILQQNDFKQKKCFNAKRWCSEPDDHRRTVEATGECSGRASSIFALNERLPRWDKSGRNGVRMFVRQQSSYDQLGCAFCASKRTAGPYVIVLRYKIKGVDSGVVKNLFGYTFLVEKSRVND